MFRLHQGKKNNSSRTPGEEEDTAVVEPGLEGGLVEEHGVELVAGATLDGVGEVADDHVVLAGALLQLNSAPTQVEEDEGDLFLSPPFMAKWWKRRGSRIYLASLMTS